MAEDVKDASAYCANLVRTHDFRRYASTLFLPGVHRRPLLAIYAFNVEISRIRDQVSQPLPGEMRLQWWIDMLAGRGHGDVEGNPVASELSWAVRTWRLPVERLARLVEEHEFDLYNDPMPSLAALDLWQEQCRRIAGKVVRAHQIGAERCGFFRRRRPAHGTAINAAATRRRSPSMML